MTYQVLLGLNDLEKNQVIHRDLKPDNLLMKDGYVKLSDFGTSKVMSEGPNSPFVVSQYYRAPELLFGAISYNTTIDMWALGVIFFEFLFKTLPFRGD